MARVGRPAVVGRLPWRGLRASRCDAGEVAAIVEGSGMSRDVLGTEDGVRKLAQHVAGDVWCSRPYHRDAFILFARDVARSYVDFPVAPDGGGDG